MLECVVARTIRLVESTQSQILIVGFSATLPNYEDVGQFLGCSSDVVSSSSVPSTGPCR